MASTPFTTRYRVNSISLAGIIPGSDPERQMVQVQGQLVSSPDASTVPVAGVPLPIDSKGVTFLFDDEAAAATFDVGVEYDVAFTRAADASA